MDLKAHIRQIPDFPKPGILFYDISTLLQRPAAWRRDRPMAERVAPHRPDRLVGIESRGFIFAAPLALRLGVGFAMVRKRGKLPGSVVGHAYNLEYGSDTIEISSGPDRAGQPRGDRRRSDRDRRHRRGDRGAAAKIEAEPVAAVFLIELTGCAAAAARRAGRACCSAS